LGGLENDDLVAGRQLLHLSRYYSTKESVICCDRTHVLSAWSGIRPLAVDPTAKSNML